MPAGSGTLYAVVRKGESVAGGDPAMAVFLRRPSALLCAAALSALATPNRLTLKRTPVRQSPKRARLGVSLHEAGCTWATWRGRPRNSWRTSTPSPAWRRTRRRWPSPSRPLAPRSHRSSAPGPHAPAARPQVVPTPGGGGPAPPPPSRRDRRAYLKVSFQKRLQLRNGARDLGNEELTLCPREISEVSAQDRNQRPEVEQGTQLVACKVAHLGSRR